VNSEVDRRVARLIGDPHDLDMMLSFLAQPEDVFSSRMRQLADQNVPGMQRVLSRELHRMAVDATHPASAEVFERYAEKLACADQSPQLLFDSLGVILDRRPESREERLQLSAACDVAKLLWATFTLSVRGSAT
jgi:hypothetical protein